MLYDDVGSTLTSYGVLFFELNTEYYLIVVINCEAYDYLHEYLGRIPRERSSGDPSPSKYLPHLHTRITSDLTVIRYNGGDHQQQRQVHSSPIPAFPPFSCLQLDWIGFGLCPLI